ncbi:MAG: hypothetical protein EBX57_12880, partial [Betaproteobacteria bacterium]|nr:hypothetical protein [Betaproteobacteria bacterium]
FSSHRRIDQGSEAVVVLDQLVRMALNASPAITSIPPWTVAKGISSSAPSHKAVNYLPRLIRRCGRFTKAA